MNERLKTVYERSSEETRGWLMSMKAEAEPAEPEAIKVKAKDQRHTSSKLRERLQAYFDIFYAPEPPGDDEYYPEGMSTYDFFFTLGQLSDCTDILPVEYCEMAGLPQGSTYAEAAQKVVRELYDQIEPPVRQDRAARIS